MKISVSKKQGKLLNEVIEHWSNDAVIDSSIKEKLKESIEIRSFDWKKLAKYSFWISIICVVISFSAIFADDLLVELIEKLFTSSSIVLCIIFGIIAFGFYYLAHYLRAKNPHKIFSNEFVVVLGVLSTAVSIAYFGKTLDTGSGHFSILFLLATIIYGLIGLYFPSKLVWIFSVLSLGTWFGTETGYVSGWGAYYLGMNYPLRFVIFGVLLTALSLLLSKVERLKDFQKSTYILGLLYLFIALWILSIFGNYGDMYEWEQVKQISLLGWGLIFGAVSIVSIVVGLKYDDYTSRSFGITFLFINLYTKFFEYFWNMTHKAIFFLILAGTFWLIGKNAEKIWRLDFLTKKQIKEE